MPFIYHYELDAGIESKNNIPDRRGLSRLNDLHTLIYLFGRLNRLITALVFLLFLTLVDFFRTSAAVVSGCRYCITLCILICRD